jgi:hypothetical protein
LAIEVRLVFAKDSWTTHEVQELFKDLDYLPGYVAKALGTSDWRRAGNVSRIRLQSPLEISLNLDVAALTTALIAVLVIIRDWTPKRRDAYAEVERKQLENERLKQELSKRARSDQEDVGASARSREQIERMLDLRDEIVRETMGHLREELISAITATTGLAVEGTLDAQESLAEYADDFALKHKLTQVESAEIDDS